MIALLEKLGAKKNHKLRVLLRSRRGNLVPSLVSRTVIVYAAALAPVAAQKPAEPVIAGTVASVGLRGGEDVAAFGSKGSAPGHFNLPHAIDIIDRQRRLYVADRQNGRVQIFDENGTFLDEWDNIVQPFHLIVTPDEHVWVSDGVTNTFVQYSSEGRLLSSWGTYQSLPDTFWGVHQFSVDSAGNLYVAEAFRGHAQKFTPRRGVDPALLIPRMQPPS